MPDKDAGTPRVFIIRHGETEWTITGRFTGSSDIPLTSNGESQVFSTAQAVVGSGKILDPSKIARVYISPRTRAKRTFELMFDSATRESLEKENRVEITQDIREWEYGLYEGKLTAEIRAGRKERGLDVERDWNIWKDGCEEGESASEMSARLDELILRIRDIQAEFLNGKSGTGPADILVFAHGHSLRAFAKRWINFGLDKRLPMMLEPGAVGVLSYEHHRVEEPALLLGVNMGGY